MHTSIVRCERVRWRWHQQPNTHIEHWHCRKELNSPVHLVEREEKRKNGSSTEWRGKNGIETFGVRPGASAKCATRIKRGIEVNHVNCGLSTIPHVYPFMTEKIQQNIFKVLTFATFGDVKQTHRKKEQQRWKIHEHDKKKCSAVWLMMLIF